MTSEDTRLAQARLAAAEAGGPASVRVDVWLWSVRQVRSRSAATAACKAGHVRVNGATAKPAQQVVVGDEIRYRVAGFDRDLVVLRLLSKRVGAPVARTAYLDRTVPRPSPLDAPAAIVRDRGAGRPTKKERRALDRLRDTGPAIDIERILDER
ncbi:MULTISPECIES: RNA-binding S4 domain-containing protein [unclassified Actinomyces]|uniref:RNA-binding S4 domain-containing protein n=1 Tax=unclassified Actinomyces TaxID=2609248 RepID=UPI002016C8EE|nr:MULTISPECIES: RNA-binding S4 domain-containing protein [unclassified Actinomyces]MCL3777476.1 RNA-binding S4 domain-containing protein [Actinomyces sp. AC-20-1]MCL3788916.1 RNA-binding S4 domain-containing protein [Actinomyces sp. 187325]MCL3791552.1 RNA-binding S4 domain-containing protein [Actinomyces sp. 186855]MCL3794189.1 RNA-binding S4 domain-containing protein [Actinomyces sp. 217892]